MKTDLPNLEDGESIEWEGSFSKKKYVTYTPLHLIPLFALSIFIQESLSPSGKIHPLTLIPSLIYFPFFMRLNREYYITNHRLIMRLKFMGRYEEISINFKDIDSTVIQQTVDDKILGIGSINIKLKHSKNLKDNFIIRQMKTMLNLENIKHVNDFEKAQEMLNQGIKNSDEFNKIWP